MRAWLVHEFGEPEAMVWAEVELPEPAAGEVRVRNHAAALNFFDLLQIQGKYQVKPPLPFTPGAEIAGVIDAVGPGVTEFRGGDHVLALPQIGGFAEYTIANVSTVFPVPGGMEWPQAAALPIAYHTAWFGLKDRGQLVPGEWLLVHAGASGVGMAAIQIGCALGARVIATAGSREKLDFARDQGAHIAFDYRSDGWVEEIRKLTGGRGADVVYDPVGGDVFDLSTRCIASGGRLLVIGFASGRIPSIAANRILLKNISIVGVYWGGQVKVNAGYTEATQCSLDALWHSDKIRPCVTRTWPMHDLPAALRLLAGRQILGKTAVTVP